jgi:RNA polymerase sigma factor (sigma-70 family)
VTALLAEAAAAGPGAAVDLLETSDYLTAVHRHRLLSAEEEAALGAAARGGDLGARNALVAFNVRLAAAEARKAKYQGRGLSYEDLRQHALVGLIAAADRYDADRGHRFSTMATWWVRQAVERALHDHGTEIRLPSHMTERMMRILRAEAAHQLAHGEAPDEATLATLARCSVEQLRRARAAWRLSATRSLDEPLSDAEGDGALTIGDGLADAGAADPVAEAEQGEVARVVAAALRALSPRERQVVAARHGLGGRAPETLEQIGRRPGLTRERVRQIEAEALGRLRERPELAALLEAA